MRPVIPFLLVLMCIFAGLTPADAQTTLYRFKRADSGCTSPCNGVLQAIDPDRPAVLWSTPIPATSNASMGAYVTPDGRYLVWTEPNLQSRQTEALVLFDVATRSASRVPWVHRVLGNPRRSEVYLSDAAGQVALSFEGLRRLTGASCLASEPMQVSGDGGRVAYRCSLSGGDAIVVFDVATGTLAASFALSAADVFAGKSLSRDGRELFVAGAGRLRRITLASGETAAEVPLPTQFNGWPETALGVAVDPRTSVLYSFGEGIYRFDPVTLQLLSSAVAPWAPKERGPWGPPNPGLRWMQFDPLQPRIYASSNETPVHDWVLTADAQVLIDAVQPYSPSADSGVLIVAPRPAAPADLAAETDGSTVGLSWSAVASNAVTLRYLVEAGTGPGLANIVTFDTGLQTNVSIGAVPSGTYYVRVRAGNVTGLSAPSNEVIVTVP